MIDPFVIISNLAMLPILSPENSTSPFWVSSGNGHLIGRHLTADNSIPPPLLPDEIITLEANQIWTVPRP